MYRCAVDGITDVFRRADSRLSQDGLAGVTGKQTLAALSVSANLIPQFFFKTC